jgi:hypothetical protein
MVVVLVAHGCAGSTPTGRRHPTLCVSLTCISWSLTCISWRGAAFGTCQLAMAFWRLDRRVPWRNSNSIRTSFREGRGGLREQKQAIRSSARAHRTAASALTNAPNLNAASHAAIFGPGKGMRRDVKRLNTCARTSDVATGLLRVRGACKRERGDGGWKKTICGHQTSSPAPTGAASAPSQP